MLNCFNNYKLVLKEQLTGTDVNQIRICTKQMHKTYAQNKPLNRLINPSFQGVNRRFVLFFENELDRKSH